MTTLLGLMMVAVVSLAGQPEQGPPGPPPGERGRGPDPARMAERIIEAVDATEEQATQIQDILKQAQEAVAADRQAQQKFMEEHAEEIKALREEMRKAREAGDEAKIAELREQMQKLRPEDQANPMADAAEKIDKILTDEQKEKFAPIKERLSRARGGDQEGFDGEFMIRRFLHRVATAVNATEEQNKQLEEIGQKYADKQEELRKQARETMRQNREKIRDLHKQLADARKSGDDKKEAELRAQIEELDKAQNQTPALDEIFADIEKILTDEQKAKFEPLKAEVKEQIEKMKKDGVQQRQRGPGREGNRERQHRGPRGERPASGPSEDAQQEQ